MAKQAARFILAVLVVSALAIGAGSTPAHASGESGCSFSVPRPTFNSTSRTAGFRVTVTCPTSYNGYNQWDRQVVVDLMEADVGPDDFITYRRVNTKRAGTYTLSASGIACNRDLVGNEELYLRVRVETQSAIGAGAGAGWRKGTNFGGAQLSVSCR